MLNPSTQIPQNLPYSNIHKFVGRDESLAQLHQLLQENDQVAIAAISGMGGVGKTQLAIQYAIQHLQDYPGGVCWLSANAGDVGLQLLEFARSRFFPNTNFENFSISQKLAYCWDNWADGVVLIVMDDVTSYQDVKPYLPPQSSRFKVLMTTRLQGLVQQQLPLDVLTPTAALELLTSLVGEYRVKATKGKGFGLSTTQKPIAEQLCDWLGYLPLGIELVGRYLTQETGLSLEKMLERLKKQKVSHQSLSQDSTWNVNAHRGVEATFEVSWKRLDPEAQELGYLLSIFALAPIPWEQVESVLGQQYLPGALLGKLMEGGNAESEAAIENLIKTLQTEWGKRREALLETHLLQSTDEGTYQLHQLIREFLRQKLEQLEQADELKQTFCQVMVAVAKQIPEQPTRDLIEAITPAIPHLAETAIALPDFLRDEDLISPFIGLGRFYQSQGFYQQAETWFEQCLSITQTHFGENHPDVATSFNNLANLYGVQGRYKEAEHLFVQALEICEQQLGVSDPQTITIRENLEIFQQKGEA